MYESTFPEDPLWAKKLLWHLQNICCCTGSRFLCWMTLNLVTVRVRNSDIWSSDSANHERNAKDVKMVTSSLNEISTDQLRNTIGWGTTPSYSRHGDIYLKTAWTVSPPPQIFAGRCKQNTLEIRLLITIMTGTWWRTGSMGSPPADQVRNWLSVYGALKVQTIQSADILFVAFYIFLGH